MAQPRVLVAADKFKGTLTSAEVGAAVGAGLRDGVPDVQVDVVPIADGGDGTLAAAVAGVSASASATHDSTSATWHRAHDASARANRYPLLPSAVS